MEKALLILTDVLHCHKVNFSQKRRKKNNQTKKPPKRPGCGAARCLQPALRRSLLTSPGSVLVEQIPASHL